MLTACGSVKKSTTEKQKLKQETGFENAVFSFEKKNSLLTLKERVITEKLDSLGNVTERTTTDRDMALQDRGEVKKEEKQTGFDKKETEEVKEAKVKRTWSPPWWLTILTIITLFFIYKHRFKLLTFIKNLIFAK